MRLFTYSRASELMDRYGLDLVLAHAPYDTDFLLDHSNNVIEGGSAFADGAYLTFVGLPRREKLHPFLVTLVNDRARVEEDEVWIEDRRYFGWSGPSALPGVPLVAQTLRERGLYRARIGVEMRYMPVEVFDALRRELPHVSWKDGTLVLEYLRAVKCPKEVERARKAAQLTQGAILAGYRAIRIGSPGVEFEEAARRCAGANLGQFLWMLVGLGPRGATVHCATHDALQPGAPLWGDAGFTSEGHTADIGRTACARPVSSRVRELHQAAVEINQEVFQSMRAGLATSEAYQIAQEAFNKRRDVARPEKTISAFTSMHGVGRRMHDPPYIALDSQDVLEVGNVLACETIFCEKGTGAVAVEDMVVVREEGVEFLSSGKPELFEIA